MCYSSSFSERLGACEYGLGWPGRSRQPPPPTPPRPPHRRRNPAHTTFTRSAHHPATLTLTTTTTRFHCHYRLHDILAQEALATFTGTCCLARITLVFNMLEKKALEEARDPRLTLTAIRSKLCVSLLRCTRLPWLWPYRWSPSNLRLPLNANTGNGKCDSMQVAAVLPRVLHP
ncbi:hypothetical protein E2C01_009891 [Portunus trituberculatus]|uniref:Uncharacterized protein n=1 Tax=Portunus trituberculatus TaxID=210409 RepID=A0A5B7D786_PORTR|nr:hypothetical protein [Portunus trituberculatus]